MEKNNEKKEIKISLWTFYVLVASLVVLLSSTVSGWLLVARQNIAEKNLATNNSVVEQKK